MKELFDKVANDVSKKTTKTYSTSFSLGIYCLNKRLHEPIYNIYGFVRFADEIVDTFLDHNRKELLSEFRSETRKAIERGISLNPILHSFQATVNKYNIEWELIECFLKSMETDLHKSQHSETSYKEYIVGSAEVVGLMCLRVFTEGNDEEYQALKPTAMSLGSAFQKVNFLRDMKSDYNTLGRVYFPGTEISQFDDEVKMKIEADIDNDFNHALEGIRKLPKTSRFGVYVAYVYYKQLHNKIRTIPPKRILSERIRISNYRKMGLLASSFFRHSLRMF